MKLIAFFWISFLAISLAYSQSNNSSVGKERFDQREIGIDSIVYSKDDAFLGYSVYDLFLNSKGEVFLHKVERYPREFPNGRKTCLGLLSKGQLDANGTNKIFDDINALLTNNVKDRYRSNHSDQTTSSLSFFKQGQEVKRIIDYGMQGTDKLISEYSRFDSLGKLNLKDHWDSEVLKISLIDKRSVDSIRLVQHLKSDGSYYRNGIAKSITLVNDQLKEFISGSKNFKKENPYKNPNYEIMPSVTDKYSLFVFYSDGSKEWIKYNGRRFVKKTYLNFRSKDDIFKNYLRKRK